jgi:23S rRNA (cytidine1920-2'-O)/16S rRNA (cytidine1409-2'-O)-methyltransferase
MTRERLDVLLAKRGLARSRSEGRDLVLRGVVSVGGRPAIKAGELCEATSDIAVESGASGQVSRGGLKLASALDAFGLNPVGLVALDIGAATGGFTELLLERGARKVYAVDVGREQLSSRLRLDDRVVMLEATDARALTPREIVEPPGAIVADVSFISLTLALPVPLSLVASDAWLIALIKPQFELSPADIGRGGIVRSENGHERAVERVKDWIGSQHGWTVLGAVDSPIFGKSGNREFLIAARRRS